MNISQAYDALRSAWSAFPELAKCHHFVYDLPIRTVEDGDPILLLGTNPGESPRDWEICPEGKSEESRLKRFNDEVHSSSSRRWFNRVNTFIPESHTVVLSELFHWSSKNLSVLKERIGDWRYHPAEKVAKDANHALIESLDPQIVIVIGLGQSKYVETSYNLTHLESYRVNGRRLAELYDGNGRPWLITKHWTGARMTRAENDRLSLLISDLVSTRLPEKLA